MVWVSALQGLGPHHRSSSSGVVHACQTSERLALNSLLTRMALFSLLHGKNPFYFTSRITIFADS